MKIKKKEEQNLANIFNIIGNGTNIKGDINTKNDIRIDGFVLGNVKTEGKLIIGEHGTIEGEINVKIADISGVFKGKLFATELVILRKTSKVEGELTTKKIVIEEGGIFNGTISMKEKLEKTDSKIG